MLYIYTWKLRLFIKELILPAHSLLIKPDEIDRIVVFTYRRCLFPNRYLLRSGKQLIAALNFRIFTPLIEHYENIQRAGCI